MAQVSNSHFEVAYKAKILFIDQFHWPRLITYFNGPGLKTVLGSLTPSYDKWGTFLRAAGVQRAKFKRKLDCQM